MIRKLVIHDGISERELVLVRPVVVGRDPSCEISNFDPLLSRRHAEFVPGAAHVTLRDLGSRNGVMVNGTKVPEHVLTAGDVMQFGHLHIRYVEEQPAPEPPARPDTPAPDTDEAPTMAPAVRPAAAAILDDTAPAGSDMDATFAVGARGAGAPSAPDMRDLDATFAPGSADPDATFLTSSRGTPPAAVPQAAPARATLVAGADLVVTTASPACRDLFGTHPDNLVGEPLGEILIQSLQTLAAGNGPPALTLAVERSAANTTITITFTAGQAIESVS